MLVEGDAADAARAERVLDQLAGLMRGGYRLAKGDVKTAAQIIIQDENVSLSDYFMRGAPRTSGKRQVTAKSVNQRRYLDAIREHDIVFGIGPAGTGKTYLAMALAVRALHGEAGQAHRPAPARRSRPASGSGFLPGSMEEKVSPYLRPLYDALHDMMDFEKADQLLARGLIEVAPIAFMRGRTLNDAFVILDEAQNTTTEQMKMFLTRLGFESKAVITGDVTQIDLPDDRASGLNEAVTIVGHRGDRLRLLHRGGRGAPPAGAADHQGVRSIRWIPTVDGCAWRSRTGRAVRFVRPASAAGSYPSRRPAPGARW